MRVENKRGHTEISFVQGGSTGQRCRSRALQPDQRNFTFDGGERIHTDDENGDLKGKDGLVIWASMGSCSGSPAHQFCKSANGKCEIPPLPVLYRLGDVGEHGQAKDDAEHDPWRQRWVIAISG